MVGALAVISSLAGVRNDFVYDDIPLIRDDARVHDLRHVGILFAHPYWPVPFVQQLYRPLAQAIVAVEYTAGHGSPVVFRIVSYLLYAFASVLVYRLASRLTEPAIAFGVGCLFAVHPVHVEAVALGVNQGELIVAIATLAAVTLYVDRRRAERMTMREWLVVALLYAVAVLTKESGFMLPLFLACADVTVLRDAPTRTPAARWRGYALLTVTGVTYLAVRAHALAAVQFAAVPFRDLRGLSLPGRMLLMLHVVPHWLRLFVWPNHLQVDFSPGELATPGTLGLAGLLGVAIVVAFVAAAAYAWRRAGRLAFSLLWIAIALVPVSNVIPTGVLLAERTLFLPSVGFLLALGVVAERITAKRAVSVCAAVLVVLGLIRSANRQSVWNSWHLQVRSRSTRS
jgi:hypothetical protein